ncbi:type II toxin-antitoxin system Phd/YefM family antitoxin [Microbacterium sp. W4I20]|uniref:type II toxin-antitoxin system Phd/YefM family antitoxin n=1 Tax=Microbacterium sp. W4I20 TaxID=3042262 RepID=UPI0027827017|nr:type II toxin-antitoxin system Phd/YefM family antitoxin [Microbacterium sp. W4I20]MDQ0727701.1 antitoxin (DNA-binding transcriptional repressor) of toxin-antitoxin stability system [Microbacterium sp. W4I20]
MSTVSASIARQSLPAQLDRVEAGEEVSITRHGRVVAVLVRPDVLAARRSTPAWEAADRIDALLTRARSEPLKTAALSPERAEELIESVRADRADR